jgi:hypothetical protein
MIKLKHFFKFIFYFYHNSKLIKKSHYLKNFFIIIKLNIFIKLSNFSRIFYRKGIDELK